MRKISFLLTFNLILLLFHSSSAQSPAWEWAKSAGGTGTEFGHAVSTDGAGNAYVAGMFSSPSIIFGDDTIVNAGSFDMFVTKIDANGDVSWARSAGGISTDQANGVAADAGGNVYVTGWFESSTIIFGNDTLTKDGVCDFFVVKYDSSGNELWAKRAGGTGDDYGTDICIDGSGNVYATGHFRSSSITFGSTVLNSAGSFDFFVVKYDSGGSVLWATGAGGTSGDWSSGISTDADNNAYITGYFGSASIPFPIDTLTNAGSYDMFVAKVDAGGNFLWARSEGGTDWDEGGDIAIGAGGNVFVTGFFRSTSLTFGSTTLTNAGNFDMFLLKYDSTGNELLAKRAGGTAADEGKGISTDTAGNVYATGNFQSPSIILGNDTLFNAGIFKDIFVVKYDSGSNVLWSKNAVAIGPDESRSIAADASGNIYETGYFSSSTLTFGTATLNHAGSGDVFIAKLSATPNVIQENSFSKIVHIYPNPAVNELFVSGYQLSIKEIQIYNLIGECVHKSGYPVPNSEIQVDVSSLPEGVYFLCLTGNNKIYSVSKLVVGN